MYTGHVPSEVINNININITIKMCGNNTYNNNIIEIIKIILY